MKKEAQKTKTKSQNGYKPTGVPFVCTCGSNTRVKVQIETRKIERGNPVVPLAVTTACSMYRDRFLVISLDGRRVGQCN